MIETPELTHIRYTFTGRSKLALDDRAPAATWSDPPSRAVRRSDA